MGGVKVLRNVSAGLCGGLFGTGLLVSGMTDTRKIHGWLDVFGTWDPTLAFVMAGAILPMALAWRYASRRQRSALGVVLPARHDPRLDPALILGSLLFGVGWGVAGLCPGPAIASLSYGGLGGLVFLIAMLAGMVAATALRPALGRFGARKGE
jgi:uncharacterized protein